MRLLTLIRHGKSSWKFEGLQDFERPLNKRGWRDAQTMAERFAAAGERPDFLLTSHATRALTTARLFARALGYPVEQMGLSEAIYECSPADLYQAIAAVSDQYRHLAVFGHNPAFTAFTNELSGAGLENIPTAGIAHMRLNIERWEEIGPGCAELVYLEGPKISSK